MSKHKHQWQPQPESTSSTQGDHTMATPVVPPNPPTPTPASAPQPPAQPLSASLSANPATITAGQSSTLNWSTTGAASASIREIGPLDVSTSGSATVNPVTSTNYTLVAIDANGHSQYVTTTVTVSGTPDPAPFVPPADPAVAEAKAVQINILADAAQVKGTLSAVAADARLEYEGLSEVARGEFHAALNALEGKYQVELAALHTLFGAK
jgi:hypothetical protein